MLLITVKCFVNSHGLLAKTFIAICNCYFLNKRADGIHGHPPPGKFWNLNLSLKFSILVFTGCATPTPTPETVAEQELASAPAPAPEPPFKRMKGQVIKKLEKKRVCNCSNMHVFKHRYLHDYCKTC